LLLCTFGPMSFELSEPVSRASRRAAEGIPSASREELASAAAKSSRHLFSLQSPEGFWCGELTADSTLESDYILLQLWRYQPDGLHWDPPSRPRIGKAVRSILERQLPDGGFNIYAGGPSEVSATVKAYCALKLAGMPTESPELSKARERILALGGLQAANSYVKINLSLFDLYPREHCPAIPPELMLLPGNFIYQMSSWTRAIVVSLSIVHAHNPRRPVPAGFSLEELFLPGVPLSFYRDAEKSASRNVFLRIDRALKHWERRGPSSIRQKAIRAAEEWMLERLQGSDGLGAIYPPMMYAIMALDVLGYPEDHPTRREAVRQFENLMVDDGHRPLFFQPFF
jgi:squalene-hopene/tetraprenyl-beta-curcumene cyclase